jgi:hypothetical protein
MFARLESVQREGLYERDLLACTPQRLVCFIDNDMRLGGYIENLVFDCDLVLMSLPVDAKIVGLHPEIELLVILESHWRSIGRFEPWLYFGISDHESMGSHAFGWKAFNLL